MAPKKKNENKTASTLKKCKEKVTKAKGKNAIKVKIQRKNLNNTGVNKKPNAEEKLGISEADLKKMLTIDRMNEVARAQLVKDCPVVETESVPNTVVKKTRARKKKADEPATVKVVPKKKDKGAAKAQPAKIKNTKMLKATAKVVPKKKTKGAAKAKQAKIENTKVLKASTPKPKTPPAKRSQARQPTRLPTRRKLKPDEDSTITSSSILSSLDTKTTEKALVTPIVPPTTEKANSNSRRTSVTSASEWSWTKDLSGSSTTTCLTVKSVNSSDFVRLDGKMPELKLQKINIDEIRDEAHNVTETNELEHSLSEDSSSSSSDSSSSSSSSENTAIENGLNLSTSSISMAPHSPTYTPVDQSFNKNKQDNDEVTTVLEMLAPALDSLDLSYPDIEESENFDMSSFDDKISVFLREEYNTILECSFLNQMLSTCYISKAVPETEQKHSAEPDFAVPDLNAYNKSVSDNRNDTQYDISRRRDAYDPNDDDDALSLFAESITGIDSTRLSTAASVSCAAPNLEEYVPQPIIKRPYTTVTYQPTLLKLPHKNETESSSTKAKPICEKQNADSTSLHKEPEPNVTSSNICAPVNKTFLGQNYNQTDNIVINNNKLQLTLLDYIYPKNTKSVTLQGVCFFNLVSTCTKRENCSFLHKYIEEGDFKQRLAPLSDEQFLQEYTAVCRWPKLRRQYIKCFADECQRRDLPKILVEIVVDFMSKCQRKSDQDAAILVELIESALMYLNAWDLRVCEQLLMRNVGNVVVCDEFMKRIAYTQNFSRFKNVFMKLTDFMISKNRTFDLVVATHILERVCILNYEEALAKTLIPIVERTDRAIFDTNFIKKFETALKTSNKELYHKLLSIKMDGVRDEGSKSVGITCQESVPSPRGSWELEPQAIGPTSTPDYEQRYTSPDTTNTDNVNKQVHEPVIIRTLNHLNPPRPNMNPPRPNMNLPRPNMNRFHGPGQPFPRKWNQRSIMSQIPRNPYMRPQKRPFRPTPLEGPPFNKFRRYGPDYYGTGP